MRYRVTLDQVMETFYATVITWEPDGLKMEKATKHYSFEVPEAKTNDLPVILRRLSFLVDTSQL